MNHGTPFQRLENRLTSQQISIFKQITARMRCVVMKIGSSSITSNNTLLPKEVEKFIDFAQKMIARGVKVVIVSSGATAAADMPDQASGKFDVVAKQAMASIGQVRLMEVYRNGFARHGLKVGQILFSKYSIQNREAYLNARNTLFKLFSLDVVPIINENDPLAIDEIRFGDNDVLGALACGIVQADAYIVFSDVDGFYENYRAKTRKHVPIIHGLERKHWEMAGGAGTRMGTGGMVTKLEAAQLNATLNIPTWLTSGKKENLYESVFQDFCGTLFLPLDRGVNSKQRWLFSHTSPQGMLLVDAGAARALRANKSLLAKGITAVLGKIETGNVVDICDESLISKEEIKESVEYDKNTVKKMGKKASESGLLAKGLVNFNSAELIKIIGKNSSEFEKILGVKSHEEVVHRNNLVLI